MTCGTCGHRQATPTRFCPECGARFRGDAVGRPSLQVDLALHRGAEERRVVTVLFADLTGSTALAEHLDPEDMRRVLTDLFRTLAQEVLDLEGTVDKYIGDAIMAVFGAPLAHEDDAIRAVEAAARMQRAMPALNTVLERERGIRLALRIGVNTGEVVAGALAGPVQGAYTVVGDTVNTAQRLQSAAGPGEILVGEATRQLAGRAFDFEERGAVAAKGKTAPVPAFAYAGPIAAAEAARVASPLIDRHDEAEALARAIRQLREGTGGVISIVADAGVGKSRLLTLTRAICRSNGVSWLEGHASSFGRTIAYLPFRDAVRDLAGIHDQDDEALKWGKLLARARALLPSAADEIVPYIGAMMSLRLPEEEARRIGRLDSEAVRRQVLRSVYLLFDAVASSGPTVVAFEDWQWADRASEQMLEHVLPLSDRLLFVWTGRPEPDSPTERTALTSRSLAGDRYRELDVAPLAERDGRELVHTILGTSVLPPGLESAVVHRSEGNPFFAEELLRSLQDMKVLTRATGTGEWTLEPGYERAVPTSVQGIIAARIDRLPEDARDVARVASVIGRTFTLTTLRAVDPSLRDPEGGIEELVRRSIVRRRAGADEYGFLHTLFQETTYAGILVRRRRELHARVAEVLESGPAERIEEVSGVIASHYARAEDWERAQRYLFKVGDQAFRLAADAEAVEHYERAIDAYARAFGDRWDATERARIERKLGEARYRLGAFDDAARHLDRSLALLGSPRPRSRVALRMAIVRELAAQIGHRVLPAAFLRPIPPSAMSEEILQALWVQQFIDFAGDLERLLYDILRTLNLAERTGLSPRTLRAYFGMTLMCHNIGLRGVGSRYAAMAKQGAERLGDPLGDAIAGASAGLDAYALGRWPEAAEKLASAATGYRALGELEPWAGVMAYLNLVQVGRGRLGEALQIGAELERVGREARDRRIEAFGSHCQAHALFWGGRQTEGRDAYERALTIYRAIPDHHSSLIAASTLARVDLEEGDVDAARARISDAWSLAKRHDLRGWWLTPLLSVEAELLVREAAADGPGRRAAARHVLAIAGRLRAQGKLHHEAVSSAYRYLGAAEWLAGRPEAAARAWQRSLEASQRADAVIDRLETHLTITRLTGSAEERAAADAILAQLRSSLTAATAVA